jgi:hypothetical protein
MSTIRVQWSEADDDIEASNVDELEAALDRIAVQTSPEYPTIVIVMAHGYWVLFGLGRDESFLQFEPESGAPPYLASLGDCGAVGVEAFYLMGSHHTEISRRHLIPATVARQILNEWVRTAIRPSSVEWEEI